MLVRGRLKQMLQLILALSHSRMEQRTNLKFLAKLGKGPHECFKLLQEIYGEDGMSRSCVFEWHKRFVSGASHGGGG